MRAFAFGGAAFGLHASFTIFSRLPMTADGTLVEEDDVDQRIRSPTVDATRTRVMPSHDRTCIARRQLDSPTASVLLAHDARTTLDVATNDAGVSFPIPRP
jgi:hypothetical protein